MGTIVSDRVGAGTRLQVDLTFLTTTAGAKPQTLFAFPASVCTHRQVSSHLLFSESALATSIEAMFSVMVYAGENSVSDVSIVQEEHRGSDVEVWINLPSFCLTLFILLSHRLSRDEALY